MSSSTRLEPEHYEEYAELCASLVRIINIDQGIQLL